MIIIVLYLTELCRGKILPLSHKHDQSYKFGGKTAKINVLKVDEKRVFGPSDLDKNTKHSNFLY